MADYIPSKNQIPGPLDVDGKVTLGGSNITMGSDCLSGTIYLSSSLSASCGVSASFFYGDGSNLTNLPGGGGGGGAPTNATYVVMSANGSLSAERVLTRGPNMVITDAGANNTVTLQATASHADAAIQFNSGSYFSGSSDLRFEYSASTPTLYLTGAFNHTGSHNLSGTLTIIGGGITPMLVMDDQDASAQIGRTHIGYDGANADMAVFAHQDNATQTNFALRQRANGQTELNAKAGQGITFKVASATKMQIGASGDVGIGANYAPNTLLDLSGGAATFHIPDGNAGAFAISGSSDTGQGDPEEGLYFGVNTSIKNVRLPAGAVINIDKKLWFGTGSIISDPSSGTGNASITYNAGENSLIIESTSGSSNGINLSGSIIARQIASGAIAGPGSYVGVAEDGLLVLTASSGGGGSPGGADTQIQYNNAGAFGASSNFRFTSSTNTLSLTGTFDHSGTLNLTTMTADQGTVVSLAPDAGQYSFNANFGEASKFVVTGTITATGSRAQGEHPNWSGPDGTILHVNGGDRDQSQPVLMCFVTSSRFGGNDLGYVGVGTNNPKTQLDIRWNPSLSTNDAGGEVVTFGTGTTTPGALYYLNHTGGWASASAHATGSGNNQLLGIALTTNATGGMLIRGWANTSYYTGSYMSGAAVYIHSGTTSASHGYMSGGAPTTPNSYSRIVGYAATDPNVIYFNPGTNWVELS